MWKSTCVRCANDEQNTLLLVRLDSPFNAWLTKQWIEIGPNTHTGREGRNLSSRTAIELQNVNSTVAHLALQTNNLSFGIPDCLQIVFLILGLYVHATGMLSALSLVLSGVRLFHPFPAKSTSLLSSVCRLLRFQGEPKRYRKHALQHAHQDCQHHREHDCKSWHERHQ